MIKVSNDGHLYESCACTDSQQCSIWDKNLPYHIFFVVVEV